MELEEKRKYTLAEIEELKKLPREQLTPHERALVNLKPIPAGKGEVRNPKGRKKGQKNWSTIFRNLMDNEKFCQTLIGSKPKEWNEMVGDTPAEVLAAVIVASTVRAAAKYIGQDKPLPKDVRESILLVSKLTYGDKLKVETDGGFFQQPVINFSVREDRKEQPEIQDGEVVEKDTK